MKRRAQARWLWVLIALFAKSSMALSPPEEKYLSYSGTAVERHSLSFLYEEHHVLRYKRGLLTDRVVLYTCRDGSPFARKTVSYVDPQAPDFELEDATNGLREGIRSGGEDRAVFFRKDRAAAEKAAALPQESGLVADAGFDEFIRANWLPLVSGKSLALHFLVPSRLGDLDFEVHHLRSERVAGMTAEVFRLSLAGALSWIAQPIDVSYDAREHVLLRYEGVSDLRDASGNNLRASISFPAGDRVDGDAPGMSAARQAPLAPCR